MQRETEARASEIDISAWRVGAYIREAIVSSFNAKAKYPVEPVSIQAERAERMTGKDYADQFRNFVAHYKRAPVEKVV